MIYPQNSVIYTLDNNQLRAFIVDRLSGMEKDAAGTYGALQIHAWSVDHNGSYFAKRYHDFFISQFLGEKAIASLKYIPSGYLADEYEKRTKLIARGRRYWELGSGIHYQQVDKNGVLSLQPCVSISTLANQFTLASRNPFELLSTRVLGHLNLDWLRYSKMSSKLSRSTI
ncbi:hypothetical protein BGZ61DRAFT_461797 [Ilyonectria robusta]|uniref:uncharacterized protein n=1 Tax=Ilyonectria robusta TaxID=1079257 RepID=UPI001E8ED819|nr:uncharacterized protein BGZ61DRAFT_461797 [Ilyonectria robusta]KAH8666259.1 hypothetical protein BGZ61DRAFT_461797 [Ilyonectria robusta]